MNWSLTKREINRQRWFERIQDWKHSGLTQKVFCEQHQLGLASFQRWRTIVMREGESEPSSAMTVLPLHITEPRASSLALLLGDDLRIEIPVGFDAATLKQLVQTLRTS